MDATPSVSLPDDAPSGIAPEPIEPLLIGRQLFEWGSRTYLMGVINVTPDSFSGDGLLTEGGDPVGRAVAQGERMVAEGADLLDVGGQSTRPGHVPIDETDEAERVVPIVRALRRALPQVPLSVDTTRPLVARAALAAGADLLNDVWGVAPRDDLVRAAAEHDVPLVLMHNRQAARYRSVTAEVIADLAAAIERAVTAGIAWQKLIVDPGIGFGKTAEQNLHLLGELAALSVLGRPILLGTSRKSTIGKVLGLPAAERLEGTLATTALGVAAGVDIVRVHDVQANRRAAQMADAIVRGGWTEEDRDG
jgi:dihydropteroate synthase